jgi:hypothetical protein
MSHRRVGWLVLFLLRKSFYSVALPPFFALFFPFYVLTYSLFSLVVFFLISYTNSLNSWSFFFYRLYNVDCGLYSLDFFFVRCVCCCTFTRFLLYTLLKGFFYLLLYVFIIFL